jgi:hypothetical protein
MEQKSMRHVISEQWGVYPMVVPTIGLIIALERSSDPLVK